MPVQRLINMCCYGRSEREKQHKCPDFESGGIVFDTSCKHYHMPGACLKEDPEELFGHALSYEDIQEHITRRDKNVSPSR